MGVVCHGPTANHTDGCSQAQNTPDRYMSLTQHTKTPTGENPPFLHLMKHQCCCPVGCNTSCSLDHSVVVADYHCQEVPKLQLNTAVERVCRWTHEQSVAAQPSCHWCRGYLK